MKTRCIFPNWVFHCTTCGTTIGIYFTGFGAGGYMAVVYPTVRLEATNRIWIIVSTIRIELTIRTTSAWVWLTDIIAAVPIVMTISLTISIKVTSFNTITTITNTITIYISTIFWT